MLFRYFLSKLVYSQRAHSLVRKIALLTQIAIALSIAAFLITLFVMNAMNQNNKERMMALEPSFTVHTGTDQMNQIFTHPVYQKLKIEKNIHSAVFSRQDVIVRTVEGQFRGGVARGMTEESLKHFLIKIDAFNKKYFKKESTTITSSEHESIPQMGEVMMGIDLARSLGVYEGDSITIIPPDSMLLPPGDKPQFEKVKISKIISTNIPEIDAQMIYFQLGKTLTLLQSNDSHKSYIEVYLDEMDELDDLVAQVQKYSGVTVETWKQSNSALFTALKIEKIAIGLILGIAGLIAASSIFTVLTLLISQKRRDIAILKTIGLSSAETLDLFTKIGVALAGIGIVGGLVLGLGVSFYLQLYPLNVLPDVYYESQIQALIDPILVVFVIISSFLLAYFGSKQPARFAYELAIAPSLRQKN